MTYTELRDIETNPYSADERRVCDYLQSRAPDVGCGNDPIGFLIASHAWAMDQRKRDVDEAREAARGEAWQPIETAPKDRTVVLVALVKDGKVWRVSEASFNGLGWYDVGGKACHWRTHWLPMPPIEATATKANKGEL